jgi:hypothetical protein
MEGTHIKGDAVFVDKKLAKRKRAVYNELELHVLATTSGVAEEFLKYDNYSFVGISHAESGPPRLHHRNGTSMLGGAQKKKGESKNILWGYVRV